MSGYREIALARCIDDAILVGGDTISFGLAGSHVTAMGYGDQSGLPDRVRQLFERNQVPIYEALSNIMSHLDGALYSSSHEGCAWAAKQAIDDVVEATMNMCHVVGVDYSGHIQHGQRPIDLEYAPIKASITRPTFMHKHSAGSILVTHGGGVKDRELRILGLPQPFLVDISFAARAAAAGASYDDLVQMTAVQLDLADGIMDGKLGKRVTMFNGGRLSKEDRWYNEQIVYAALETIGGVLG